jgi:hypothetical protein
MSRKVTLGALAVALIWLYGYLLVLAFGYAAALPIPAWWRNTFGRGHAAFWMWSIPFDLLVTAVVSAPFALLIARYYRRTWLLVALLAAAILAASDLKGLLKAWALVNGSYVGFLLISIFRTLAVLPVLTWLARRLPSDYRWGGL